MSISLSRVVICVLDIIDITKFTQLSIFAVKVDPTCKLVNATLDEVLLHNILLYFSCLLLKLGTDFFPQFLLQDGFAPVLGWQCTQ